MKKFKFILLSLLLCSCGLTNVSSLSTSSSSTSFSSSIIETSSTSNEELSSSTSSSGSTTSSLISSSSSIPSSSSKEEIKNITIKDIKEEASKYKGLENNVGVYESNKTVEIDLVLIACLDAITTQQGYGNRYKILMSDGEDYIYVKTSQENYKYLEKYADNRGVYKVKGNISLYNNEVEITVNDDILYLEGESIDIDYNDLAT